MTSYDKRILTVMRLAFALIYLWFGLLKFFPHASPAEGLAQTTIDHLFLAFFPPKVAICLLAGWEVLIAIGLFVNRYMKWVVGAALLHMAFTFTPLFLFPELCFTEAPFQFTLVGQYILKNLVFVAGLLLIYPKKA